jgi:hypothetical protein
MTNYIYVYFVYDTNAYVRYNILYSCVNKMHNYLLTKLPVKLSTRFLFRFLLRNSKIRSFSLPSTIPNLGSERSNTGGNRIICVSEGVTRALTSKIYSVKLSPIGPPSPACRSFSQSQAGLIQGKSVGMLDFPLDGASYILPQGGRAGSLATWPPE